MEKIKEALHIALNNLMTNVVRSFLSILGVVIGIAAVITVLSIGSGAKQRILEQISSMGVNVFTLSSGYDESTQRIGEFELDDLRRLSQLPFVLNAVPQLNIYKQLRSRSHEEHGSLLGADNPQGAARNVQFIKGRNFSPIEMEERSQVCIISDWAESALFEEGENCIGQNIYVDETPWQIIGVYSREGNSRKKNASYNYVEAVAPINSILRTVKDVTLQSIEVHAKSDAPPTAKDELLRMMERDDPKRKGLYMIRDQKDLYKRSLEIQKGLSLVGALVAGVSLIVGGIGMMNVMLTSVAERTREIGIRRAVGARKKDILFQFLVESCVLSIAGGFLGLLFGAALARGLPLMFKQFFNVAPRMQPSFLVLSVGAGMVLGIVFGFYPAVKASKLSPAEALRTE